MKEELDKKLVRAFPLLYGDRNAPMQSTAMCWGFPGDGWFDLIWDLSSKLEPIIQKFIDEDQDTELYPKAAQVKEKFGGLRFYMTCGTSEIYDLTDKAEALSLKTCEECGKPGEKRDGGWIHTLCDDCHENWDKIRAKRWETPPALPSTDQLSEVENKAIFKFNNSHGALLCSGCRIILKEGYRFSDEEVAAFQGEDKLEAQYCNTCEAGKEE